MTDIFFVENVHILMLVGDAAKKREQKTRQRAT